MSNTETIKIHKDVNRDIFNDLKIMSVKESTDVTTLLNEAIKAFVISKGYLNSSK